MNGLMKEIDISLKKHNLPPISDVVNNHDKCLQYINGILKKYDNKVAIPFRDTRGKYDFRVKHVVFSFGLGFFLSRFCGLGQMINKQYSQKYENDDNFTYIWLTLCLYHDFGYFIGPEYVGHETLGFLRGECDIFKINYCTSRYSERLYRAYYNKKYCEQEWEKNYNDLTCCEEVGDHGILGGYVLFQRLCASEGKLGHLSNKNSRFQTTNEYDGETQLNCHRERIPLYQDICFRIMEHNIWKKNELFDSADPFCEIDLDHYRSIGPDEPLLFLLCLVDTIEMTKRFCQYSDSSSDKTHSIYPKTLGSKVSIEISNDELSINYRGLVRTIRKYGYPCDISNWIASVIGLPNWVQVDVECNKEENLLKIFPSSSVAREPAHNTADLACAV